MFAVQFVRSVILPRVEAEYRAIRQHRTAMVLQLDFAKAHQKDHLMMQLISNYIASIHRSSVNIAADIANALLICANDPVINMVIEQSDLKSHKAERCSERQWKNVRTETKMQLDLGQLPINDLLIIQFHVRSIAQICIDMLDENDCPMTEHVKMMGREARELRYHLTCAQELFLAFNCQLEIH